MFWLCDITSQLDIVEQMIYLMFIHDLDDMDAKKAESILRENVLVNADKDFPVYQESSWQHGKQLHKTWRIMH